MPPQVDIIYLSHNRLEFTKKTIQAIVDHTRWELVHRFYWYDDDSTDGTREFAFEAIDMIPAEAVWRPGSYGAPVDVMNRFLLLEDGPEIFAKLDNDTLVCPNWLGQSLGVMDDNPELDLLGIEPFDEITEGKCRRHYRKAQHIGGIGLMRRSAFRASRPHVMTYSRHQQAGARFGFTEWQVRNTGIVKGWLRPALPIIQLDLVPFEPWKSLNEEYVRKGWSRPWPLYDRRRELWPYLEGALNHG